MRLLRLSVVVVFAAVAALAQSQGTAFSSLVKDAKTRIKEMNVEQLKAETSSGEKPLLIDVREDSEWAAGHAAGALHLSKGVIERDIESKVPDKSKKVVLYCGGGARSALAADSLQKMGYTNVFSLDGGLAAYKKADMPVEK